MRDHDLNAAPADIREVLRPLTYFRGMVRECDGIG
jgi:hypothetical protein